MPLYYILWFVITVSQGHLMHFPVKGEYKTEEACFDAAADKLLELKQQWPDDPGIRVYCEERQAIVLPMTY